MTGDEARKERERQQLEALGELARSTLQRLEVQDEIDWQRQQKYENEPMVGEATWHVHEPRLVNTRRKS